MATACESFDSDPTGKVPPVSLAAQILAWHDQNGCDRSEVKRVTRIRSTPASTIAIALSPDFVGEPTFARHRDKYINRAGVRERR